MSRTNQELKALVDESLKAKQDLQKAEDDLFSLGETTNRYDAYIAQLNHEGHRLEMQQSINRLGLFIIDHFDELFPNL